jgi:UDP-3-O-acyl N-acetylglucosamine deacetylase
MIEHIMAALYGLQIDNCIIAVNRTEMPGFDGSAQSFVDAIDYAGKATQFSLKSQIRVHETIRIGDDENCWIQIEPADDFRVSYKLDYPQPQIGRQSFASAINEQTFRSELATARTFLLKHEAEWLLQQGLGQRVSYQHVLVFGENGPIDNQLRFANECVRHKTLDVIGDLALCGHEVLGHITASRTGHRLNGELVQRLLKHGAILNAPKPSTVTSKSA